VTDGPRLPPVPVEELTEEQADAFASGVHPKVVSHFLPPGPDKRPLPNGLAVLLHHPYLAKKWLPFSYSLLWEGELSHRERELMVLRVAWRTRSTYEWVQHCQLAQMFKVPMEDIEAISEGRYDGFTELERDLLVATDDVLDTYRISDDTWKRLATQLDEKKLSEVALVIGAYIFLAIVCESFGGELDPDSDPTPFPRLPEE
jgi:4-carboxymuconolactone decarboxylase